MLTQPSPDFYCTDWSLAIDEPLAGTAVSNKVWLFLEYNQPWAANATSDNSLPQSVQDWLAGQGGLVNGRLQFIKQPRGERTHWAFFVACFSDADSRIYRFDLPSYDDLFALDLSAIVAGKARYDANRTAEAHILVCTNGKRDVCCALHGVALLRALASANVPNLWETTHLGGHRFAPTLLTLPDGVNYGLLHPQDVPQFLTHLQNRTLWLEKLRGRVCYEPVVQVAEQYLRQETADFRLDTYQHTATQTLGEGVWQVQFQASGGQTHIVTIETAEPLTTYPSSGSLKAKTFPQFRVTL
ncbi:sucrase ferredoxin [Candidatus Leptofilum sp.]|uniref:sucrase ferredoxin n=1 Tax=Candidatus Leptofilum sp. TaxID=3241576 RepID=UPI003B58BCE4